MSKKARSTLLAIVLVLSILGIGHRAGAQSIDGAALYGQNCAGCHGPLASSTMASKTAAQIQTAINSVSLMSGLKNLTAAQINAIAAALSPSPPPPPPPSADTTRPTIKSFSVPSTSSSLTVSITAFTATDNVAVTGYMVTESSAAPSTSATGWSATAPSSYTFASAGAKTLYAWAKDAAGNVSQSRSAAVTITSSEPTPTPTPTPPPAQGMTIWIGKWFKVTEKNTGYNIARSAPATAGSGANAPVINKDQATFAGYLKFWGWDPENKILQGDRYEQDAQSGQWNSQPFNLSYIAGTDFDFLCWAPPTADSALGFTARIQGREASGVLQSATFKTLGGYYMETSDTTPSTASAEYWAGGLSITGTMIPDEKVPVPSSGLVH